MMTQTLGTYTRTVNGARVRVLIVAVWLDDPAKTISEQLPTWMSCPNCGFAIGFTTLKADRSLQVVTRQQTSTLCTHCSTTLIIDKTAAALRAGLAWVQKMSRLV